MGKDFDALCADIQAKVRVLSTADDINLAEIVAFNEAVTELLQEITAEIQQPPEPGKKLPRWARRRYSARRSNAAAASNTTPALDENSNNTVVANLIAFMREISQILNTLKDVAQNVPNLQNFPAPKQILEQLSASYERHVVPMVQVLEKNKDKLEAGSAIAGLGAGVFNTCSKLYQYSDRMDTKEKICAVMGTVLMFAGIGMLIAATINPTTLPVVAGITVVYLGFYLCHRAIQRHENEQSKEIKNALNSVNQSINTVTAQFEVSNAVKDTLRFGAAMSCGVTKEAPAAPTWVERITASVDRLVDKFFMRY
jgi:hypothetical protein